MRGPAQFIGTCIGLEFNDLQDYDDSSRAITYRTFLKHVGREEVRELNKAFGVPIGKDWHVSFSRGIFAGKPAVCLFHSAIHHLYAIPK